MRYATALLALLAVVCFAAPDSYGVEVGGMKISSSAFEPGGKIPVKHTCDGQDVNPALAIEGVPVEAASLALIVDDPDAPSRTWVHWVVWNIDPSTKEIGEDSVPGEAELGVNDFRKREYGGPCPPSGEHRYFFKLYALDRKLRLGAKAGKAELEEAMEGHIVGRAEIIGVYSRKR